MFFKKPISPKQEKSVLQSEYTHFRARRFIRDKSFTPGDGLWDIYIKEAAVCYCKVRKRNGVRKKLKCRLKKLGGGKANRPT